MIILFRTGLDKQFGCKCSDQVKCDSCWVAACLISKLFDSYVKKSKKKKKKKKIKMKKWRNVMG